jgi:hypothetical protein
VQTIYADGVSNITLIDGVVRFDLIKITQVQEGKAAVQPISTLAISLPAFLRFHDQLNTAIAKMVEQGVVKKNTDTAPSLTEENIRINT